MKILKASYLLILFLLCFIEIYYELYFTALIQTISLTLLFYTTILNKRGLPSRLLILLVFLISYPIQIVIVASGQSTLSGFHLWEDSNFSFEDTQVALVILVSSIFYLIFIFAHNICFYFLNRNTSKEKVFDKPINYYGLNSFNFINKKISSFNISLYLWIVFFFLVIILIIQNRNGWGIWALPPYEKNLFRLVGITYYLRDYLIPTVIFLLLVTIPKINILVKFTLMLFSIIIPLMSLSKLSLIFYFLILLFAFNRDYFLTKTYKPLNYKNIIVWIFLIVWGIFIYYWMIIGRMEFMNKGLPIRNQFFLMINLNILNYELLSDIIKPQLFFSIIERFLGLQGLASSLFYKWDIYNQENFLVEFLSIDSINLKINSAKMLISSTQAGGLGIDWISKLVLMQYFMIIPILMIFFIFLFQVIIIKNIPHRLRIPLEIILMIIFLRFAIDGNFIMIRNYSYFLILIILFLIFINLIKKRILV